MGLLPLPSDSCYLSQPGGSLCLAPQASMGGRTLSTATVPSAAGPAVPILHLWASGLVPQFLHVSVELVMAFTALDYSEN